MAALGTAWNAVKWTTTNLTPLGARGRVVTSMIGATSLGAIALAPTTAYAKAAAALEDGTGVFDFLDAASTLAWEGAKIGADIGYNVGGELPDMYRKTIKTAQDTANGTLPPASPEDKPFAGDAPAPSVEETAALSQDFAAPSLSDSLTEESGTQLASMAAEEVTTHGVIAGLTATAGDAFIVPGAGTVTVAAIKMAPLPDATQIINATSFIVDVFTQGGSVSGITATTPAANSLPALAVA